MGGPIRLLEPSLPDARKLLPWIEKIDANRQYTNFGPLCRAFEEELASLSGATHAVTLSSCTLGLELALGALALPRGGTVLIPALTFAATATCVIRCGLNPLFADVDEEALGLTPDIALEVAAANRIDAVVPVSLHGHVQDAAEWDTFSDRTGIPVLIDAAGVAGYQKVGARAAAVFSLHATKPLGVGEGGFFATSDATMAERVRKRSNFGFESGRVRYPGTNAKMSEYHSAVGLAALSEWPKSRRRRELIYDTYAACLNRPELRPVLSIATLSSASPTFSIHLHAGADDEKIEFLLARGVETRRWYWPPLHRHPAFRRCRRASELRVTEKLAGTLLGLPFHIRLGREEIDRVADALAGVPG